MRLLAALLLLTVQRVTVAVDNPCHGILVGTLIDPDYCYKYVLCYKEVPEFRTCPEGTIFSIDEIGCVPGDQKTCIEGYPTEPEEGNSCRGVIYSRFPHPKNCTRFYSCVFGRQREHSCQDGCVFSTKLFICLPGNSESCEVQIFPTTTTPAPEDVKPIPIDYCVRNGTVLGRLPHPQFCSRFIQCRFWVPSEEFCPNWTIFTDKLSVCVPGDPNTCRTILDLSTIMSDS
ncbi:probable endochitinase [Malaya genurostris]|uniref:probable endochitinase n=1 Tax=Malaya genurostris TaxID=325434 RepID=UPI0026F39862|nr:probable endochitinase [Malaya genurostris]